MANHIGVTGITSTDWRSRVRHWSSQSEQIYRLFLSTSLPKEQKGGGWATVVHGPAVWEMKRHSSWNGGSSYQGWCGSAYSWWNFCWQKGKDSEPLHRETSSLPDTRLKLGAETVSCHLWACVPIRSHLLLWQEKHSYSRDNASLLSERNREKGCLGAPGHCVQAASLSGEWHMHSDGWNLL